MGEHRAVMIKAATRLLDDRDAAEDIAQQASVTALSIARSKPAQVHAVRNPSAWLATISQKLAYSVLKTEARRRELNRKNESDIRHNLFPIPDPRAQTHTEAERVLDAAPLVLTERQLEIFRLLWQGMKNKEIARKLGTKPGTVRWHQMKALRRLQDHICPRNEH